MQISSEAHKASYTNSRMWDAESLKTNTDWQFQLPEMVIEEFKKALPNLPEKPEEVNFVPSFFPALMLLADEIKDTLFKAEGVCLIKGLAETGFTPAQQRLFYAVLGMALGTPLEHYGLLYPIKDCGVDYTKEALPVSMTCAETEFHTDSSSVDANPDILSLLCETPSLNGGESQVSNGLLIYHQLKTEAPEALKILKRDFIRDIVTPGKEPSQENLKANSFPIYTAIDGGEDVLFRYMRYWIQRGQEKAGEPLNEKELDALNTLDRYLNDPKYMVNFHLEQGDMIYFNNKMVAHNRTEYKDTPGNVRLLWRMWVSTAEPPKTGHCCGSCS